jgi:hypothetical protein
LQLSALALLLFRASICQMGKLLKLGQQLGRVFQKLADMVPDGALQGLGRDDPPRAGMVARTQDAIVTVTLIVRALRLGPGGFVRHTKHR